jgi:antitoxin component YwqK of YwqJK toxin-antitoxin module
MILISMEMDIMAPLVRLPGKLLSIGWIWIGFFSCMRPMDSIPNEQVFNVKEADFHWKDGKLYRDTLAFSGTLFSLFDEYRDTASISSFKNGQEHGIWKKYYPGGTLKEIREYDRGMKVGLLLTWWDNGNKQLRYSFHHDVYEGICKEWNPQGVLIKEMNYKNGQEAGSQKMFTDNGKIRSNYIIKNGRRYGLLGTKNCINVSDQISSL